MNSPTLLTLPVGAAEAADMSGIVPLVQDDLDLVNRMLDAVIDCPVEACSELSAHVLHSGGKRLRPVLTLLAAKSVGGDLESARVAAASVELVHTATLIHDDMVDDADTRRGRPAAHRLWGLHTTVLSGDYLFTHSLNSLAKTGDLRAVQMLCESTNRTCVGELQEIALQHNINVSETEYRDLIDRKTAELMSCAAALGAVGLEDESLWVSLAEYGRELGMAFQMVDDMLDVIADRDELGKPVGNDIREGKVTLPLIRTLEQATEAERRHIKTLMSQPELDASAISDITSIVHRYDGVEYTLQQARRSASAAAGALRLLPVNEFSAALMDITAFVVSRRT